MRLVALLCLALVATVLGGCGLRGGSASPDALRYPVAPTPHRALWVGFEDVVLSGQSPSSAADLLESVRARGFTAAYIQVKDESGALAFAFPEGRVDCAECLPSFLAASERTGFPVIAAYPVFLGATGDGEALTEYVWDDERRVAALRRYRGDGETRPSRLNPADPSVQAAELNRVLALARTGVREICLTHVGYPGPQSDFSELSRLALEGMVRQRLPDWPDSVVSFASTGDGRPAVEPGPLWGPWLRSRAMVVRRFVRITAELVEDRAEALGEPAPLLRVMVPGHYRLHYREGVNWADPRAEIRVPWPQAPFDYEATGFGDSIAALAFESFNPVITVSQARDEGFQEWASMEAMMLTAARLVPRETNRAVVLSRMAFAEGDRNPEGAALDRAREAEDFALRRGWSVIVLE